MANFYSDNDDLRFYMERYLDWSSLVDAVELGYRHPESPQNAEEAAETYREVLDLVGRFAAEEIAPRAAELDRNPPRLVDGEVQPSETMNEIFEGLKALGLQAMCLPRELEGMGCPLLLNMVSSELLARADVFRDGASRLPRIDGAGHVVLLAG